MKHIFLILAITLVLGCGRKSPTPDPLPPMPPDPTIPDPPKPMDFKASGKAIRIEGRLKAGSKLEVAQVEAALNAAIEKLEPVSKPAPEGKKVIVALFSAPWCGACKQELPKLTAVMNSLTAEERSRLDVRLYVGTGYASNQQPTQDVAERYRRELGLGNAKAYVDPWRWQLHKKWVSQSVVIPSGAILSSDESVLKSLPSGKFSVDAAISEALKY